MIPAPPTPDEEERLAQLFGYDVLDTEAEAEFDDLTQLASQICGTPIALISLVDPDRQWFKSKVGLDAEQTERDIAFCSHAIHQEDIFEIEDATKDPRFHDNPLVTGDLSIRFYAGAPLITPTGQAIGTLCVINNQPQKLTEAQRVAVKTLSNNVISLLELRRKNKALEKANQFKSDFLAYVSHELRTPLNAINTFSRLLLEESQEKQYPQAHTQTLKHIRASGDRLLEVVNAVLDYKKIEAGKMTLSLRPIATYDFFEHLYSSIAVKAREQGNPFTFHIDESVPEGLIGDDTKLSQIMLNLLSNAVKYTPPGNPVSSSVYYRNGKLSFVVEDKGIGISEEDQTRLFKAYQRVETRYRHEGTGLGLVITQGLLSLMKGKLNFVSKLGVGTTVKIAIPMETASVEAFNADLPTTLTLSSAISKTAKILVVEDHEINRIVAQSVFASLNLSIDLAHDGEASLEAVSKKQYDIVFMDLELPGISGNEAAAEIHKTHPDLPIVALTADVIASETSLAPYGISGIVTKPIDQTELVSMLNDKLVHQ